MADMLDDKALVLFAVKLVQPGMLRDVTEGFERLFPADTSYSKLKASIQSNLESLRYENLVCLYAERRYMLTAKGEAIVEDSGIRHKIEARRMFLLKETRKANRKMRSDAKIGY